MEEKLIRLNRFISEINNIYHDIAFKMGISDSTMLILYAITDEGESCLLSDIYIESGISKQTVNSSLRKLEAEGMVYLAVEKGRNKRVYLTENGKKLARDTAIRLKEMEKSMLSSWQESEVDAYIELTARHAEDMKKKLQEEFK